MTQWTIKIVYMNRIHRTLFRKLAAELFQALVIAVLNKTGRNQGVIDAQAYHFG